MPAILAMLVAVTALTVRTGHAEPAADGCITEPNSEPPQGSHWYYRTDRAANRRCWYLGPEGAKVLQAQSPKRLPSAGSSSQPTPESSAQASKQNGLVADASTPWLALPKLADATDHEPASMSDNIADKHATTDSEDEMPVPTAIDLAAAERAPQAAEAERPSKAVAAERPPEPAPGRAAVSAAAEEPLSIRPEQILAVAAAVLALVAIIFRTIYKLFAVRTLQRRRNLRDQGRSAATAARSGKPLWPALSTVAAGRPAAVVRDPFAPPRYLGVALEPIDPGDASHDLEEDLRRLLHNSHRKAA
jgi:hypothetical protein